jgi:mannose-1-phosphate guanylyltransferase/mannose-6-phosphate isomerase
MATIQPVILSGGSGSRLWPASRSMYPKQLLPLVNERTMLQDTVGRLEPISDKSDQLIVVCNEAHRFLVAEQLASTGSPAAILLEPEGRNTAPAIALAALYAMEHGNHGGDAPVLLVLPADHVIADDAAFARAVETASAAAIDGGLVAFGIVPASPNTGYGYIKAKPNGDEAVPLQAFVEKPDFETARSYVDSGEYFWNSGMFVFRADRYLEELGRYAPEMLTACQKSFAGGTQETDFLRPDTESFIASPSDSIDYAIMEKTDAAKVVPLDAGWNDVGSWDAIYAVREKDAAGNVTEGDTLAVNCTGSIISSESRLVAAVGVEDLAIVETKDAVLVTHKSRSQDVKLLVDELKDSERAETSLHRQVYRPWGSYDSLENEDGWQVKRLVVRPGAVLSLQMHNHRAEHWVVVKGTARITLNEDEFDLGVNESTYVPIGATHRIANVTTEPVHIIEVQCGDYLGEDDIVRFEDDYGREGTNT